MIPETLRACGKTFIICNNCAAFTGLQLTGMETETSSKTNVPPFCPLYSVAYGASCIFNDFNSQLSARCFYFFDLR